MRMVSMLFAALAALSLTPALAANECTPFAGPVKIFLLSGQSNMTGRDDLGNLAKPAAEQNLANLIQDLRKEFEAPGMNAVIAVTGFGGRELAGDNDTSKAAHLKVIEAQFALPKRPEFAGTVATVETRDFYRPQEPFGGNNQTIHWHGNGESYWLMGEAMGRAMVNLLVGKSTEAC